jgi:putative sulfotransferase
MSASDNDIGVSPGSFVLGTGRCGSTLISDALDLHSGVLSLADVFLAVYPYGFPDGELTGDEFWSLLSGIHGPSKILLRIGNEPPEFMYPVDGGGRFGRGSGVPRISLVTLPRLAPDPDALLDRLAAAVPSFPRQPVAAHYRRLFELLAAWLGRTCWVERSGGSAVFADELVQAFPAARYVHLRRDLEPTARSMSRHPGFRLAALRMEFINRCGCDVLLGEPAPEAIPADLEPLLPDRISTESFAGWNPGIEYFRFMASFLADCIIAALAKVPASNVLTMDYEEIVAHPAGEFTRLGEFLDLGGPADWARAAARLVRPARPADDQGL